MKGKRISAKGNQHKILGEEADKLKDKLDQLKEQIKVKKQQKQMTKTSTSIYSTKANTRPPSSNRMNATQSSFGDKSSLRDLLGQLKIENIESRLKEKGIVTSQQFKSIDLQDIDQWKDIQVGYRIKMKKYIQKCRLKEQKQEVKNQNDRENENYQKEQEINNIESIIKNRKQQNKFVPISRIKDVESEGEHIEQLEEEEQEKMMLSIMEVFRGRASSLKNKNKKVNKHVHWSPQVQQMEKQHQTIKKYPKQTISKSLFDMKNESIEITEMQNSNSFKPKVNTLIQEKEPLDYKYCWICLKKVEKGCSSQQRYFCGEKCLSIYQQTVDLEVVQRIDELQKEMPNQMIEPQEGFEIDFDIV